MKHPQDDGGFIALCEDRFHALALAQKPRSPDRHTAIDADDFTAEPASPPAPAGGAREWLKEHSAVFTGMDDIEYVAGHMERYAAQVSKSEREARERAERALRRYGEHEVVTGVRACASFDGKTCDCGFEAALAALKSSQEEGKL